MSGMMRVRHLSKKMLFPVVIVLVAAMGIGLFFMYPNFSNNENSGVLYKGPAAKVNGKKIKDEDFNRIYTALLSGGFYQVSTSEEIKDKVLEYATEEMIIKEYIKKNKISIDNKELERFMNKMVYDRFKTPEELQGAYNYYNVKNKRELANKFRETLNYRNMWAYLAKKWGLKVTEEELKEAYEEVELAHILVATNSQVKQDPLSDEEAKKRAEEAYQKVKSGTDFATVAREYSDDSHSKDNGGSLGTDTLANLKRSLVKDFMAAVVKMKAGEISAPVKTEYGYHIIKVVSRTEAKGKEFETVKKDLERDILTNKLLTEKREEYEKWLKDEVKKAKIEIIDPALRAFRLKKEEKWEAAALAYEKALKDKRYRDDLEVYLSAAESFREANQHQKALAVLDKYELNPNDVRIQMAKANVYDAMNDKKKAKDLLVQAAKNAGEDLYKKRAILVLMEELKYEEEAKALEEEIKTIQARIAERQKQEAKEYEEMMKNANEAMANEETAENK